MRLSWLNEEAKHLGLVLKEGKTKCWKDQLDNDLPVLGILNC